MDTVVEPRKESSSKPYSYDEVLYPNNPFPQSHPDRLATIATLFGMKPQRIDQCRVLELGCGRGGNLVPMAEQLPGSQFVGVELSRVQITEAQHLAESVGLTNIELKHMSILDVDASFGEFDYIITHGVFSWVPREVQDKILDICATHLKPQGVAYVSYNTYPGWNMRGMIRDMMCYHSCKFDDPRVRIQQARALLDFMAQHSSEKSAFGIFLKHEVESLRNQDDGYLYHEHLEDVNDPIYFFKFAERAEARGLRYLGETDMSVMYTGHFPAEVTTILERVASDFIQMEQYMDFIRNRMFRQTLLRHRDVVIDRELRPSDLETLHISSGLTPENPQANLYATEPMRFRESGSERSVNVTSPLLRSALLCLSEVWPGSISYPQLIAQARQRVDRRAVITTNQLHAENHEVGTDLLRFYVNNLVELHSQPPPFTTEISGTPRSSRLARVQIEQGNVVTTLRHSRHRLSDFQCHLLRYLDGTRDHQALSNALMELVEEKVLVLQQDPSHPDARTCLSTAIEEALRQLARVALLQEGAPIPTASSEDRPSTLRWDVMWS